MCGRFVATNELETLKEVFNPKVIPEIKLSENFNVSPTQDVYIIMSDESGKTKLETIKWGFSASWDPKRKLANARSESILEKKSFKEAFLKQRCLVPINGYFEWFRVAEKPKQAYFIYSKKMKILPVAGIYQAGEMTILTRAANTKLAAIHDRMPVLVPPLNWQTWLNPSENDPSEIMELIPKAPVEFLSAYPVGSEVNSSKNQGKGLIKPIGEEI